MRASVWLNFLDPNWSHISYSADFCKFIDQTIHGVWPSVLAWIPRPRYPRGLKSKHLVLKKPWFSVVANPSQKVHFYRGKVEENHRRTELSQGDGWSYGSDSSQRSWYRWLSAVEFRCGSSKYSQYSCLGTGQISGSIGISQKITKKSQVWGTWIWSIPTWFPFTRFTMLNWFLADRAISFLT